MVFFVFIFFEFLQVFLFVFCFFVLFCFFGIEVRFFWAEKIKIKKEEKNPQHLKLSGGEGEEKQNPK